MAGGGARYVIKAPVRAPGAATYRFTAAKTMYGGRRIAPGDVAYVFASENAGGPGLIARGVVVRAAPVPARPGLARQTPRVSVVVRRTARARRPLGRAQLKPHIRWDDGRPQTELNFKFYRQATDKIGGISARAAAFLDRFFR
jgi:hypothetical protein